MKSLKQFLAKHWIEILVCFSGFLLLFLLLWFRLGSMTFGNGASVEVLSRDHASSWQAILAEPLNAPYTVMQRLVMMTGHSGITSMRLVSTLWAIAAMILFYLVARQWHSARVASIATWLFISSSWFLHSARLATPEIAWFVAVLGLVVVFTPTKSELRNRFALACICLVLSLTLYIPGMVWLVLASLIVQRKKIEEAWQATEALWLRLASLLAGLISLAPLAWAFSKNPSLITQWAGISIDSLSIPAVIERFASVPVQLFFRGPDDPVRWLGQLPVLSVFELLMFLVGIYFYVAHFKAARARFIILLSIIAWLVLAVGGVTTLSLIVPVVYLFVATGIAFMLRQWMQVFPNNPLARSLGIGVVVLAVALTSLYQTRSYFVAWRYSPDTIKAFDQRL